MKIGAPSRVSARPNPTSLGLSTPKQQQRPQNVTDEPLVFTIVAFLVLTISFLEHLLDPLQGETVVCSIRFPESSHPFFFVDGSATSFVGIRSGMNAFACSLSKRKTCFLIYLWNLLTSADVVSAGGRYELKCNTT
jgi:hypothetical protein